MNNYLAWFSFFSCKCTPSKRTTGRDETMEQPKVVVIGGGTGLSVLLRGLKKKPFELTAIVTVGDDGGSSGRLRKDLNIPPPGDIRNVIVALAETEPMMEQLFQHRFTMGEEMGGHSLGNLMLAAMTEITGDFRHAVKELQRVLAVRGDVLPVADEAFVLCAEMEDGERVTGESAIPKVGKRIHRISLAPTVVHASEDVLRAIGQADMIVFGPGSLYTSLIPNLLVPGVAEAIRASHAKKVYICNVMTQRGETEGYSAADHVQAIYDHADIGRMDAVLVNDAFRVDCAVREAYKGVLCHVEVERERLLTQTESIISDSFILEEDAIHHDAGKLADSLEVVLQTTGVTATSR